MDREDYNSPAYKSARFHTFTRDRFICQNCGGNKSLQIHHIKKWSLYPELRYTISNLITLCEKCHNEIRGKEEEFEEKFMATVARRKIEQQNKSGVKLKKSETKDGLKSAWAKWRPKNPRGRF